jgi:hypothetical protein
MAEDLLPKASEIGEKANSYWLSDPEFSRRADGLKRVIDAPSKKVYQ